MKFEACHGRSIFASLGVTSKPSSVERAKILLRLWRKEFLVQALA